MTLDGAFFDKPQIGPAYDAAPGKPVFARGVYAEWMNDPEPRFQLVKPLGLLRITGGPPPIHVISDGTVF